MSKYISKNLTREDVIDAIKIILSKEGDIKNEDEKSFKEKFQGFLSETKKCIKDLVTLKFISDFCKETGEECKECAVFVKKLVTFQFLRDFLADLEREPLDKEKLIKYGKKLKSFLAETIETIVFVVVMVILIRFFICELRWIPSGSMRPTLVEGDRIVVERYSRFKTTPQRGDIMVFYPPFEKLEKTPAKVTARLLGLFCKDTAYIKRVIGVPGDKIEIKPDAQALYVNDELQDEPYISALPDYSSCKYDTTNCGPFVVPEGQYFMMGDNRNKDGSWDSRYWGFVPEERFIGRAVFLFWPIDRMRKID